MYSSCQILDKKWQYNGAVLQLFIDFKKAHDSVRREHLYNIFIELGISMRINSIWTGRPLIHSYQECCQMRWMLYHHCFLTLLSNNTISKVQANQQKLQLNGIVYVDNLLSGNIHVIKKNTQAVLVASKEHGRDVNTEKTWVYVHV